MHKDYFFYDLYGLIVQSDIQIPELETPGIYTDHSNASIQLDNGRIPDVTFRLDDVDTSIFQNDAQWFCAQSQDDAVIRIPEIASYAIKNGREIIIDALPGVDSNHLLTYLLGTAMGCLLHQRGLMPLHISAINIDGVAWAFTAPSGTGKSTLVARLHSVCQVELMSDDVALVSSYGPPMLIAGLPIIKVAPQLAEQLFEPSHIKSYSCESGKVKAQPVRAFRKEATPLAGIIWLERGTTPNKFFTVSQISGANRLLAARESIYRYRFARSIYSEAHMAEVMFHLATHINFYRMQLGAWEQGGLAERRLIGQLRDITKSMPKPKKT